MAAGLAALIVDEGKWLPLAMALAGVATAVLWRRAAGPSRTRVMAALNLFAGATLTVMGVGHLLAVATKHAQGTLEGSPATLYPIGVAVTVPALLMVADTRALANGVGHARRTVLLNGWLAATLVLLGLINAPLALAPLLNIGYRLHARPVTGRVLVAAAVLVHAGLFIGGLMFMASGQNFEQFSGME
jgi:hypothetical protein